MQIPNQKLTDLFNTKTLVAIRDTATGETVFEPRKAVGQDFMFVPPNGRVIVGRVERCDVHKHSDGFMHMSITCKVTAHTTVDGVLKESSALEFAPPPVKPKRRIEEA
jgi:hypothetical protein